MEIKRGIPVSAGAVIGPALVLDTEGFRIPLRYVDKKERASGIQRLHQALAAAAGEARDNQQAISDKLGKKYGAIFTGHAALIEDPELVREIEGLIREENHSAEYALSLVMRRHAKALENAARGGHFATRAADLFDIEKAILGNLLGQRRAQLQHLKHAVVVLP